VFQVRKFIYWNINNKHSPSNIKGIFILCILDHTILVKQISSKSFSLCYKNIIHKNIIVYNISLIQLFFFIFIFFYVEIYFFYHTKYAFLVEISYYL